MEDEVIKAFIENQLKEISNYETRLELCKSNDNLEYHAKQLEGILHNLQAELNELHKRIGC